MSPTTLLTPAQASQVITARVVELGTEILPLAQCIGRTLRQDVHAERDQPPFDRVTMDGIAVSSAALGRGVKRFAIQALQAAGGPTLTLSNSDQAIEVMTGASLPLGCDLVIPVENLVVMDGAVATLAGSFKEALYANVHRRGSDARQGACLLESGALLRAPEIAVAASAGMPELKVARQPRITVISTGNELIDPGGPIAEFQVRRSNVYAVSADLRRRGFLHVRDDHAGDSETALQQTLTQHLFKSDVLVLSGGVSMGKFDLVPQVLSKLGVQETFHKIAQRPGKPMWFGIGPQHQTVFALPGNPVSTLVCLMRYVIPALLQTMGTQPRKQAKISLASPLTVQHSLTSFLPVLIDDDQFGRPMAIPKPTNSSGDFLTLINTDGFVELPPGPASFSQGFVASFYPW